MYPKTAQTLERFRRGARALVAESFEYLYIHEIENHVAQWFIVMELLEGKILRDCVQHVPIPLDQFLELATSSLAVSTPPTSAASLTGTSGTETSSPPTSLSLPETVTRCSAGELSDQWPSWAPDGSSITYHEISGPGGHSAVKAVDSADGRYTYFASSEGHGSAIYRVAVSAGKPERVASLENVGKCRDDLAPLDGCDAGKRATVDCATPGRRKCMGWIFTRHDIPALIYLCCVSYKVLLHRS